MKQKIYTDLPPKQPKKKLNLKQIKRLLSELKPVIEKELEYVRKSRDASFNTSI